MFFLRRIIKSLLITAIVGFVIRKAMGSTNPKVARIGHQANRFIGGPIGLDESGRRRPRRRAVMTNSAGSALVGGLMSYFFDPHQGRERRERAKSFARERIVRRNDQHLLPAATPTETTGDAPYGTQRASAIT